MKISRSSRRLALVASLAGVLAGGCTSQPKSTEPQPTEGRPAEPQAADANRAKGDALVKAMSDLLAGAKSFTFATDETHHRTRGRDQLIERKFSRELAVRRPDAAWFRSHGDLAAQVWYADKKLTVVSDKEKVWTSVEVPGTLDEAMDDIAVRFDILMPMADLMYSSPWDAYMSAESTGGWVGSETIGGKQCHHVAYRQPVVDWELWIEDGPKALPCQLAIVYKTEPGPPRSKIVFRDWNLAAEIPAERLSASIPEGYERIGMIERVATNGAAGGVPTTVDPAVGPAAAAAPTPK